MKPFYRLVQRRPNHPFTDRLVFANDHNPTDRVIVSEWWFWRLWRYTPTKGDTTNDHHQ